jgi:hypothetical protein
MNYRVNYRLDKMKDGRYLVRRRRGIRDMFFGDAITFVGPSEPDIPDRPLTRQEFYALLSDLAAKGFWDNLLP